MEREIFLGTTKDGSLAFAKVEVRYPRFYNKERGYYSGENLEFSASFQTYKPLNKSEYDLAEALEEYVQYEMDENTKLNFLEKFDCSPSQLSEKLAEEETIEEWVDNSCFPLKVEVNGDDYIFKSESGGQHDLRDEMEEYRDKPSFNMINDYWDKYHLKSISENEANKLFIEIDKSIDEGKSIAKNDESTLKDILPSYVKKLENLEEDYEI